MVPVRLPSVVAIWLSEVVAICVPHLVAAGLRRVVPIVAIMSWRLVGCQDQAALNATKKTPTRFARHVDSVQAKFYRA